MRSLPTCALLWIFLLVSPFADGAEEITTLKRLCISIQLTKGGKPVARIVPTETPLGASLAKRLQRAIKNASGAVLPIVDASAAARDPAPKTNSIVLGNMTNSAMVWSLHRQYLLLVDRYYPGDGGYVIRSVHDPWGTGANVISLGASDDAGLQRCVEAFEAMIPPGSPPIELGRLCVVQPSPSMKQNLSSGKAYLNPEYNFDTGAWYGKDAVGICGFYAYLTGRDDLAKVYRDELITLVRRGKGYWIHHAKTHSIYISFDLMEEHPAFSDADRLEVTNAFLALLRSKEGCGFPYSSLPRNNHNTRAWFDNYLGARYIKKYYQLPEADEWLRKADEFFAPQVNCNKSQEDSTGHQFRVSLDNVAGYALLTGKFEFFESGAIREAADRVLMLTNNLGHNVINGCAGSGVHAALLAKAATYYKDPSYYFPLLGLPSWRTSWAWHADGLGWSFYDGSEPTAPTRLLGVRVAPLARLYFDNIIRAGRAEDFDATFDKMTFRRSFEPMDEYLVLDGISGGGHSYDDANTVLELTARGRLWLNPLHTEYGPTNLRDFNGVMVVRDGRGKAPPQYAMLKRRCEFDDFGFVRTLMPNYGGADWHRNIFWMPGDGFVFLDEIRTVKPGHYMLGCRWYGWGRLADKGVRLRQGTEKTRIDEFVILPAQVHSGPAPTPSRAAHYSLDVGGGAAAYAFKNADVPVLRHQFQELVDKQFSPGERYVFANYLFARELKETNPEPKFIELAPGVYCLDSERVFGLSGGKEPIDLPGTKMGFRADAFFLSRGLCIMVGATELWSPDWRLKTSVATNVRIDLAACNLALQVPEGGAHIELSAKAGLLSEDVFRDASNTKKRVEGGREVFAFDLAGGTARFELGRAVDSLGSEVAAYLAASAKARVDGASPQKGETPGTADKRFAPVARTKLDGSILDIAVCQGQDPSGAALVAGDATGRIVAFSPNLEMLWSFSAKGPINSLVTYDLDGTGQRNVIAGSDDCYVYVLDYQGKIRWKHTTNVRSSFSSWTLRTPMAKKVVAGALDGDGKGEIAVGFANMHVHLFDHAGKELWHRPMQYGTPARLMIADVDGDGVKEIVGGCGAPCVFSACHVYSATGKETVLRRPEDRRWEARRSLTAVVAGDVNDDGTNEIIYGTDNAVNQVAVFSKTKLIAELEVGGSVSVLLLRDRAADGKPALLVGTQNGFVSCFSGAALEHRLWYENFGSGVRAVVVLGSKEATRIVVGCEDGRLWELDKQGRIVATSATGPPITRMELLHDSGHIVIGREDGRLELISLQ